MNSTKETDSQAVNLFSLKLKNHAVTKQFKDPKLRRQKVKTTVKVLSQPQVSQAVSTAGAPAAIAAESTNATVTTETDLQPAPEVSEFTAVTDVFGKKDVAVSGVTSDENGQAAIIDFASENFTLDELFSDFSFEATSLFVFDNVKLAFISEPDDTPDTNTVAFSGELRMQNNLLQPIYNFLKLSSNPLFTASIETQGKDLSEKLRPVAFTLTSAGQFFVPLTSAVTLSAAAMQIRIEKEEDAWKIVPEASGMLTFNNISSTPVTMQASIGYKDSQLTVSASITALDNAFGINGLNLQNLSAAFAAGAETSIDVTAEFAVDSRTLNFTGKLTPTSASALASADNFTLTDLNSVFNTLTGTPLGLPEYDVTFSSVSIGVATADTTLGVTDLKKGFTVMCSVNVFDHECDARAFISTEGVSFEGALGNITIGPVDIKKAALRLELHTQASQLASGFALLGTTVINSVTLNCKVAYEKTGSSWNCIIYAGLNATTFGLSTFFPQAAGSFVDTLQFSKAAVIYATAESTTQDPDFAFPVKQGLQLTGTLEEIPALSSLTNNKQIGLQLTALLGTTTSIGIAMPDTKLNLGSSVICDPFSIAIQILPEPEFDLLFGLDVIVPDQDTPLHFDLKLGIGIEGANGSGTMKGYWQNPFGVTGLQIGPDLALQLDIIYAQFVSTGTPSGFGFVGGLMLGDIEGKMALSISEDPTGEILYGEVDNLSPANLVKFVTNLTKLQIDDNAIPNFFDLKQLKIYVAPLGGTIGTVVFEKGFSFACDLVLFNKEVAVYASLNDDGLIAKGHLDNLQIGPLQIKGENGQDAELDLELTTEKQSVLIDGAIDFAGSHAGLFTEINKDNIEFKFDLNFVSLLKYTVTGKSIGTIADPASLDFTLDAVFDNDLTAYLKNTLAQKITDASQVASRSIEELQNELTAKEAAYKAEYDPAFKALNDAQAAADAYLQQCQQKVAEETQNWNNLVDNAQRGVDAAKADFDNAFSQAQNNVIIAQRNYDNAVANAQWQLDNAKATANAGIDDAQNKVNAAKADYDNATRSAINTLQSCQNSVNSIQWQIDDENNRYNSYSSIKQGFLYIEHKAAIAVLEGSKYTATLALNAAQAVVNAFASSSSAVAFGTANAGLDAARRSGQALIDAANQTMTNVLQGAEFVAFNTAKDTLNTVQQGAQYTAWQAAAGSLQVAQTSGRFALDTAISTLQNIGTSAVYITLQTAQSGLDVVQNGTAAFAYEQAKLYLEAAKTGEEGVLQLSAAIAAHSGDIVDIKHVELSARLKDIENGNLFNAQINLAILNKDYDWTFNLNVQDTTAFIKNLFDRAYAEAKAIVTQPTYSNSSW